jgi:hypothetical protein
MDAPDGQQKAARRGKEAARREQPDSDPGSLPDSDPGSLPDSEDEDFHNALLTSLSEQKGADYGAGSSNAPLEVELTDDSDDDSMNVYPTPLEALRTVSSEESKNFRKATQSVLSLALRERGWNEYIASTNYRASALVQNEAFLQNQALKDSKSSASAYLKQGEQALSSSWMFVGIQREAAVLGELLELVVGYQRRDERLDVVIREVLGLANGVQLRDEQRLLAVRKLHEKRAEDDKEISAAFAPLVAARAGGGVDRNRLFAAERAKGLEIEERPEVWRAAFQAARVKKLKGVTAEQAAWCALMSDVRDVGPAAQLLLQRRTEFHVSPLAKLERALASQGAGGLTESPTDCFCAQKELVFRKARPPRAPPRADARADAPLARRSGSDA